MNIVCVLFPNLTQLDLTGPFEVFHRAPGATVHLAAATREPVTAEGGLSIVPTCTFDDAPDADIMFVPGGTGVTRQCSMTRCSRSCVVRRSGTRRRAPAR